MGYVVGDVGETFWQVVDSEGQKVTGLTAANFELVLGKDGVEVGGSPVTVTPLSGALAGTYRMHFTSVGPTRTTYLLQIKELDNFTGPTGGLSLGRTRSLEWVFGGVGEDFDPSYEDAWCSLGDIERYAGEKYTPSNRIPNDTQVRGFAVEVASRLTAMLLTNGVSSTPAGGDDPLDVSTQVGRDLSNLLRQANAIGAASKAKGAVYLIQEGTAPIPALLWRQFLDLCGGLDAITGREIEGAIPEFLDASGLATEASIYDAASYADDHQPENPDKPLRMDMDFVG